MTKRFAQLLCFGAACAIALAAGGQGTFELTYDDFDPGGHALAMQDWQRRIPFRKGCPLKTPPEGVGSTDVYFCITKPFGTNLVAFLLDLSGDPTLYVDTDSDLDLSDEHAMVAPLRAGAAWFGPFRITAERGGHATRQRVALKVVPQRGHLPSAHLMAAGAFSGRARLGDTEYAVAVVDHDLSGRCNDVFELLEGRIPKPGDYIAIDLDGDGRFGHGANEVLPLGKLVRVAGAYYSVEVSADGSSVTFGEAALKYGAFKTTGDDASFRVWSDAGVFVLKRSNRRADGTWQLPVGTYAVGAPALMRTDDASDTWWLSCSRLPEDSQSFSIAEGKTHELAFGTPLRLEATVTGRGSTRLIGIELLGQGGESYQPGAYKNGRRVPAPTFRIVDAGGNELASGQFDYG